VARTALKRVCEHGSDAARPGEHGFGSRKRRSSYTACRTTMCREVARDARGVAMRRLQADRPGSSRVARGGCRRPLKGKQRMRSSDSADYS
jgi:hypothetical protein